MKKQLPKQKHVALRTCIGTGVKKPKNEMIRLVKTPAGNIVVDVKGKERGRGANLDMTVEAFDKASKKGAIERALKLRGKLKETEIIKLKEEFLAAIEEKRFRQGNNPVVIRVRKEDFEKKIKS